MTMYEADDTDDTGGASLRADYDLDAWQPPAAPDVTDAVVARLREPAGRAALESVDEGRDRAR
ncbi:MAG: hypothetical protein KIT31_36460, partial [Deltaproteobacteria bacterium]|nr:hypothetical protein [Deltaproteobacteria bacterium]